jgi:gas vesicle protein
MDKKHHKTHHEHHEMHHEHDKKHHGGRSIFGWMRGFLIGGTAGILLSLVVAPQSGRETRDLLRYKSLQLKHAAEKTAADAREKADHLTQDARLQVQTLQQRGREYVDEQRERVSRVVGAVKGTLQDELEQETHTTESGLHTQQTGGIRTTM